MSQYLLLNITQEVRGDEFLSFRSKGYHFPMFYTKVCRTSILLLPCIKKCGLDKLKDQIDYSIVLKFVSDCFFGPYSSFEEHQVLTDFSKEADKIYTVRHSKRPTKILGKLTSAKFEVP